jgi:hypothetical protein
MYSKTTTQSEGIRLARSETREVHDIERIALRIQNIQSNLVIRQGACESLLIEADPNLLTRVKTTIRDGELTFSLIGSLSELIKEALTTSFSRRCIHFILTVKQLNALDITGIIHLEVGSLETDHLALHFKGPGKANINSLQARILNIEQSGPCKVEVSGKVDEQQLSVSAIGFYYAPKLVSKKAIACLNGPSQATVSVSDNLDAIISGPGRLEYYGNPKIKQNIFPIGSLVRLDYP